MEPFLYPSPSLVLFFSFLPLQLSWSGLQTASCLKKCLHTATVVGSVFESTGLPLDLVFLLLCWGQFSPVGDPKAFRLCQSAQRITGPLALGPLLFFPTLFHLCSFPSIIAFSHLYSQAFLHQPTPVAWSYSSHPLTQKLLFCSAKPLSYTTMKWEDFPAWQRVSFQPLTA